jgi:hypothetical protein
MLGLARRRRERRRCLGELAAPRDTVAWELVKATGTRLEGSLVKAKWLASLLNGFGGGSEPSHNRVRLTAEKRGLEEGRSPAYRMAETESTTCPSLAELWHLGWAGSCSGCRWAVTACRVARTASLRAEPSIIPLAMGTWRRPCRPRLPKPRRGQTEVAPGRRDQDVGARRGAELRQHAVPCLRGPRGAGGSTACVVQAHQEVLRGGGACGATAVAPGLREVLSPAAWPWSQTLEGTFARPTPKDGWARLALHGAEEGAPDSWSTVFDGMELSPLTGILRDGLRESTGVGGTSMLTRGKKV